MRGRRTEIACHGRTEPVRIIFQNEIRDAADRSNENKDSDGNIAKDSQIPIKWRNVGM